jgi:hypothetical protein
MPDPFFRKREANQTPTMSRHEVNGFCCDLLGGHTKITLILAIFVVHENDHAAMANLINRLFYGC